MRPSLTTPRLRVLYGREQVLRVTLARRDPHCFDGAQTAPGPPRFITRIRQRRVSCRPLVAIRRRGRVLPTAYGLSDQLKSPPVRKTPHNASSQAAGPGGRGMPQSVYPWQSERVCRGARGLAEARIRSTCVVVPFSTASGSAGCAELAFDSTQALDELSDVGNGGVLLPRLWGHHWLARRVLDVLLSLRRDLAAARAFFSAAEGQRLRRALGQKHPP
jgi:hypothetical protein